MISLKKKLKNNNFTLGSWINLAHPSIAEIMAQAGFEWLTIDMEHSTVTLAEAQNLIQVIGHSGAVPLVRVEENNATFIKRVMDAGAHGVIVPMINSAEEARKAVSAVKYPPTGNRGVGLSRAQGYGFDFERYKNWLSEESIVIVQIEHIRAIEHLEDILTTQGVDGSIIGPYDLSASLGYPGEFEREEVKAALKRYEEVCKSLKKPMGFHIVQPDSKKLEHYRRKGYTFIAIGVDFLYLGEKCREIVVQARTDA